MKTLNNDVLGCSEALLKALSHPAIAEEKSVGTEGQRASLWLAVALGRCRIFGVTPEQDGVLPPWIALAAAHELLRQTRDFTKTVKEFVEQYNRDDEDDQFQAGHILFMRMDLWAGYIAIDEAYQAAIVALDDACREFRQILSPLTQETEALDAEMQSNLEILCVTTETNLLSNWRDLLAEPYKTLPPWWLDGSLELQSKIEKTWKAARQQKPM